VIQEEWNRFYIRFIWERRKRSIALNCQDPESVSVMKQESHCSLYKSEDLGGKLGRSSFQ